MFREVADRTMDDHVAALITCVALAACGAAQTISETDQGKNFVKLLKDKGFKDVGAPEWEDDSEQTTRRVNGRTVRRTTKERVVEITVTMNGCTVEFEQVRNPNALSTDYVLDEFGGRLGSEISVAKDTEVGNLSPKQVSEYITPRRETDFKFCYSAS
jgi:hypothetical protein